MSSNLIVFGGSGSPQLTKKICEYLNIPVGKSEVHHFSEGTLLPRVLENVRGADTYIVQSTAYPADSNFMELVFWVDALKRASAASITVVMPYFSYAKGDKKDEPRIPIRARVCANSLQVNGADRIVVMDLHAAQISGFFNVPVDDLTALGEICKAIESKNLEDLIVVSPDPGFAKKARKYAEFLGTSLAIGDKIRSGNEEKSEVVEIIGDVKGKIAFVVDDFTVSGGTLISVSHALLERGAKQVYAAVSHGVLSPGAMDKINSSPIEKFLITDTVENQPEPMNGKIEVVSVAEVFGEAIRRIQHNESVSMLFEKRSR